MREPNAVDNYVRLNPKTGLFEPIWLWRAVLPYWLGPDPMQSNIDPITINATGSTTRPVTYKLPHSSQGLDDHLGNPLLINRLVFEDQTDGTNVAQWTIFMEDIGEQLRYMNFPVHIRTFAGGMSGTGTFVGGVSELSASTGMLPALLSEPLLLPTRHNLMFTFNKVVGGSVSVRLFPVGGIFDTWSTVLVAPPGQPSRAADKAAMVALVEKLLQRRRQIYPFWFTTDNGPLVVPANQTLQQDVIIGDDGHFEATHIMAVSPGEFEVEFFNPDTRQTLMNGRIHSGFIGDSFNPQPFPCSMVFPAGSTVRFIVKDLSGFANTVYLTLRGRRIRAPLKNLEEVKRDLAVNIPLWPMAPSGGPRR